MYIKNQQRRKTIAKALKFSLTMFHLILQTATQSKINHSNVIYWKIIN